MWDGEHLLEMYQGMTRNLFLRETVLGLIFSFSSLKPEVNKVDSWCPQVAFPVAYIWLLGFPSSFTRSQGFSLPLLHQNLVSEEASLSVIYTLVRICHCTLSQRCLHSMTELSHESCYWCKRHFSSQGARMEFILGKGTVLAPIFSVAR